jgi:ABC-type transport system involved in multi-copper enzyme maturation permease subunit
MVRMARVTVAEATRRRLTLITLMATAVFLGLWQWVLSFLQANLAVPGLPAAAGQQVAATLVWSLSLFFCYVMITLFAVLALSGAMAAEVESGALLAVASRPLSRAALYIGRLTGYSVLLTAYAVILVTGVTALVFWHFPASTLWPAYPEVLGALVLEGWVMAALTMLGSVWLPGLANGLAAGGLFFAAFLLGAINQLPFGPSLGTPATVANLLWPTDGLYRLALAQAGASTALSQFLGPFGVRFAPSSGFLLYGVLYLAAAVGAGAEAFRRRDL